jgi:hypothetical protein
MTLTLETYNFGLARTATQQKNAGQMRFVVEGEDKETGVVVDRLVGQWWALECHQSGEIKAECAIDVHDTANGKTAYMYHPDIDKIEVPELEETCEIKEGPDGHDDCHIATDAPFPQGRSTHWRLCYAREIAATTPERPFWRLRDERSGELWFVKGYAGPMNINWFDKGSHIFADGRCWVDDELIAHFSDAPAGESGILDEDGH